jgi:hypothetical protein
MELVPTQPASFENLFDGVSARYCNIDGMYYVSVCDLIIGTCVKKLLGLRQTVKHPTLG